MGWKSSLWGRSGRIDGGRMRKSEKEALQAMLDDEQETIKALEKA